MYSIIPQIAFNTSYSDRIILFPQAIVDTELSYHAAKLFTISYHVPIGLLTF